MEYSWMPYFTGFWIFPILCMLFMLIMMFACGRMFFRGGHRPGSNARGDTPRDILDRRYASGEIGKEQYDSMRRSLTG